MEARSCTPRTLWLTSGALVCFAANSMLCRYALGEGAIDAASFTTIRLVSGAAALFVLMGTLSGSVHRRGGADSWLSAVCLFAYAGCFSFAYLQLTVATGALLLFGGVEVTMILGGMIAGEWPLRRQWIGLLIAVTGLTTFMYQGFRTPSAGSALLMLLAGAAWGIYSLRGRRARAPLGVTAFSFLASVPMTLTLSACTLGDFRISVAGLGLAVLSGAVASAVGYILWFGALAGLTAAAAATAQLAVPVVAAAGGVLFLSESLTLRLVVSSLLVLGGVGLTVSRKTKSTGTPAAIQWEKSGFHAVDRGALGSRWQNRDGVAFVGPVLVSGTEKPISSQSPFLAALNRDPHKEVM